MIFVIQDVHVMKRYLPIILAMMLMPGVARAQGMSSTDVFNPISKYFQRGSAESLSAWFADNLEIEMLGRVSNYSRSQACQIMKSFFLDYTPKSFVVQHKSGSYPINCAVGEFEGGGYRFVVTIQVKTTEKGNSIQQIRIERL